MYYEHVTNYIYGHADKFSIKWIDAPAHLFDRDDIRLTIDDENDFNMGKELMHEMKQEGVPISPENILSYLDSHTQYLDTMKAQIKMYTK